MHTQVKNGFLFFAFTLFLCLNSFFLRNTIAQDNAEPVAAPANAKYTFESIEVPGVDFLAITASSDFEDYAGYTKSADGEKDVAFTLIDGVFMTYDFPGSQNTYFFALGNNGNAAGHYEDSNGLFHGIVLENGELREYNFPDSVETEIYGISDATGALTGNFIDASGVRRGFSADEIIEVPEATETFADFVNSSGGMVGSYIDADGLYHPYIRTPAGRFVSLDLPEAPNLEYFFVHGINDAQIVVARTKRVDDLPGTLVGTFRQGLKRFKVPGSVFTEGYNINQDGSIVGNYESADGRRHGFIARPITDTAAPVEEQPIVTPEDLNYTYETIDVPGVDFLALTASSDFEDYAGYTKSADGQKDIAFTLIDGVFTTYDFPGSQNTHFYALGNNGNAAGYYQDSEGLHHGVVLENGELRQYDFPNAVQTEIYGISDATGALTGNFIDASGVRRGFSGDLIIEAPEASATFADFVNATGRMVGSYIDADGLYHPYMRQANGRFISLDLPEAEKFEYFFVHGINDVGILVGRSKRIDGVPRTHVGSLQHGLKPLTVPGSVITEGWNINQDGSIVGHYDSADGRRHGFIARSVDEAESNHFGNAYTVTLSAGLNMLSVPLAPPTPVTAKNLVAIIGATTVITLDTASQRFTAWTPSAPDDGFAIEGGKGYIVNVREARDFAFVGAPWMNPTESAAAAPTISTEMPQAAWAFVVSGRVGFPNPYEGKSTFDGYQVVVRNLRTNSVITTSVQGDYFAAATADLTRRSVVEVGDIVELRVIGPDGNVELQTVSSKVTREDLANAVLSVNLDGIGQPTQNRLLQNYPNPFNPETWIPYQLSEDSLVSVSIYDTTGQLVRNLSLGFQSAGFYNSQGRAAYWDGRNALGERVASGIYFYQLTTPTFQQTRRLVIVK
ncbi:MAG: T9SS type A sorting domain-containing protein [Candidatus Poribacteria bacterium]|nr:T9SS type A sorting domain-containing protein [Candidatus Poribacteria bacterium]